MKIGIQLNVLIVDTFDAFVNVLAIKKFLENTFVRTSDKTLGRPKEPATARDISVFLNNVICKR